MIAHMVPFVQRPSNRCTSQHGGNIPHRYFHTRRHEASGRHPQYRRPQLSIGYSGRHRRAQGSKPPKQKGTGKIKTSKKSHRCFNQPASHRGMKQPCPRLPPLYPAGRSQIRRHLSPGKTGVVLFLHYSGRLPEKLSISRWGKARFFSFQAECHVL